MRKFLTCTFVVLASCFTSKLVVAQEHHTYIATLLNEQPLFDTTSVEEESTAEEIDHANEEPTWRAWATVENYTYGKDRGSIPMITDLNALHPYFRDRIQELMEVAKKQGIELVVVESFRTHAKQAEYFGMGRKYTRSKGGNSKHQYGMAVDLVPIVDGKAVWDNTVLWRKIGVIGERLGLRWGGRWRAPYDPAHFEWSGGLTTMQLSKGLLPTVPKSKAAFYPCLHDEIEILQQHWAAWEVEQSVFAKNAFPTAVSGIGQRP